MSERDEDADDYLWDRSGKPDPEVARLEEVLGRLRYAGQPLPAGAPPPARRLTRVWKPALAAAALLLVALAVWPVRMERAGWELTWLDARGERASRPERLRVGDGLVTGAASRVRLAVGLIGEVIVEPRTRLRLLEAGGRTHRLALERGTLHARIWAPPGSFFVDTPSAVAADLGCAYTLEMDENGTGRLRVESGWVGFELHGRESFVPEGAACRTRPGAGPGTPHYEDASAAFQEALDTFDASGDPRARAAALRVVLAQARRRDALSLWHLLVRAGVEDRGTIYDRLAALVPPPALVRREGIVAGDTRMLDAWWDALDLGTARFWRSWKGAWPERTP